ncbi:hypothetical protein KKJ26_07420 [Xenorhabdus bovienii]|nr:hypothetical protein [Xenorhabdus bovienii]
MLNVEVFPFSQVTPNTGTEFKIPNKLNLKQNQKNFNFAWGVEKTAL